MARPKKVVTEAKNKPEIKTSFTKEEIQSALEITHKEYFIQTVALLSHDSDTPELNYVKVPVVTPEGGNYLVSILHIDGPKLNLRELDQAAKIIESENKNPEDIISGTSKT